MQINWLQLQQFRNYNNGALEFPPGVSILAGDNAQGKTNLLESIFLLTGGRSWRAARRGDLISFGCDQARIEAKIFSRQRDFSVELRMPRGGKLQSSVNGVRSKRQGDLAQVFRCVLFSPEDLQLIREGPGARRRFLDMALCQLRPRYELALTEYNRLLEHKSKILKLQQERPTMLELLPEFNARMAKYGAAIIRYRAYFIEKLAEQAILIHSIVSGSKEDLTLYYQTVSTVADAKATEGQIEQWLLEHSESHGKAELASCQCLTGPHRDDLQIDIDGALARGFASQGQTRTAALALKFAERAILKEDCGEYPVMLLDDVLSELDAKRQEYLIQETGGGQVIITCCEKSQRLQQLRATTFLVERGTVQALG